MQPASPTCRPRRRRVCGGTTHRRLPELSPSPLHNRAPSCGQAPTCAEPGHSPAAVSFPGSGHPGLQAAGIRVKPAPSGTLAGPTQPSPSTYQLHPGSSLCTACPYALCDIPLLCSRALLNGCCCIALCTLPAARLSLAATLLSFIPLSNQMIAGIPPSAPRLPSLPLLLYRCCLSVCAKCPPVVAAEPAVVPCCTPAVQSSTLFCLFSRPCPALLFMLSFLRLRAAPIFRPLFPQMTLF